MSSKERNGNLERNGTMTIKFDFTYDRIAVKRLNNGKWNWQLDSAIVGQCFHYNDDMFDTPGEAADAAWAFVLEQETNQDDLGDDPLGDYHGRNE
jgi:hypothetical protein